MSSCQDSMDTEDSIPRPEYEDIVPTTEEEDDDDIEFWMSKPKTNSISNENGVEQRQETTTSQPLTPSHPVTTPPRTVSTSSNRTELHSNKNAMDVDDDNEEISYDEADEEDEDDDDNDDEDEVQEEESKSNDKGVSLPVTLNTVQKTDDPLTIQQIVKPTTFASTSTTLAVPVVTQNDSKNNKVVLVTLIKENGKFMLPIATTPVAGPSSLKALTPEEEKSSPMEEVKSSLLIVPKEDQPRSSTPKGTREFIALQRAFTESKVLSEFVNEKERPRKSRKLPLKSEDSTTNDSTEKEKFRICRARSKSCTRTVRPITLLNNSAPQKWPSDEKLNSKRENMRSQNTDFVQKQMKFLNRVNHEQIGDDPLTDASDGEQSLNESSKTAGSTENKDDFWQPPPKRGADSFCWKCRKCADLIPCSKCPRSYHYKCIKVGTTTRLDKTWICPECVALESCINGPKKGKKEALSQDMLNQLLLFALKRMKQIKGHEKLLDVPDENECPLYSRYVVNPVTLNTIENKITNKGFKCTEEFVLETKWIQHNVSIAYAAFSNKYGLVAKNILKVCRQEAAEIETCSECYLNANTRKDWFIDVCLKPHILLWAKLKGFPYWPAKGMGLGPNSLVNVRFFGDHDRAFVPVKDCFLYSECDPNPPSGKRAFRPGIADCIKEVDVHIEKIKSKVGAFNYAKVRTNYDPSNESAQLEEMMPGVTEYMKRQQAIQKPPLTYKIVKTAGNNLSFIRKPDSGTDSDHSSLGVAERKNARTSTEISKPSPLSEVVTKKPAKDSSPLAQSSAPKITTTATATVSASSSTPTSSKPISIKSVSSNYEVVPKPQSKDENNSSKITSVILKRKSDVVLLSPSVKKSKSSEESPIKENTNSSSGVMPSSPKQEAKVEEKEPEGATPAKRTRSSSRSIDKMSSKPPPPPTFVAVRGEPPKLSPTQLKSQSHPQSQQSSSSQNTPTTDVPTTSTSNKDSSPDNSNAMVKLVQNRQGVTIKKIIKKPTGLASYFASDDLSAKSSVQEKMKSIVERFAQTRLPPITTKAIALPDPDPKPTVTAAPKAVLLPSKQTTTSPATSKATQSSTRVQTAIKHSPSPPLKDKPKGLIPFEDIKLERPDEDEELAVTKPTPTTSKAVDPTLASKTSSTPNSAKLQSTDTKRNVKPAILPSNPPLIPVNPDAVKKEVIESEDSSQSAGSQENASPPVAANTPTSRPSEAPRLIGETMIQRIVVRSIESLTHQQLQPPALKSVAPYYLNSRVTTVQSCTAPATTSSSTQSKTTNARARKSFPNKGPNASTAVLPPDVKRSLTKNSMVYIPGDSQSNTVPIQPLTAVSKPVNHNQVKATSTATIPPSTSPPIVFTPVMINNAPLPTSSSNGISLPQLETASSQTEPASSQPEPAVSVSAAATATVSTSVTNITTDSVTSIVTAVSSPMTYRQGYISSLKTLSPLQMTTPAPTSDLDLDQLFENHRAAAEEHILSGISPSLAAAITDTIVCGPPKLTPRPNGALRSDGGSLFNSNAGPVCKALMEGAHKMTDFFISVMQDTVSDMANSGVLQAKIVELTAELETRKAEYEKHLEILKINTDRVLCNMKESAETESRRLVSETRKQCEIERIEAIAETKKSQWCKNCSRLATYFCCWNTAYCSTNCQSLDWSRHKPSCMQINTDPQNSYSAPRLIPAPSTTTTLNNNPTNCYTTQAFMPTLQPHQTPHSMPPFQAHQHSTYRCRPNHPTQQVPPTTSASLTTSTLTTIAGVYPSCSTSTNSPTTNNKDILKLPPSTYLRALAPSVRINSPTIHRFNIPLPMGPATAGGPPYTLVHRAGNWELLSATQASPTMGTTSAASIQQPQRPALVAPPNLPQDSRISGSITVRPNHI